MNIELNLNICRVCMNSERGKSLLVDDSLQRKFNFVTKLTIDPMDNLPSDICGKCVQRLKISFDFIKCARETDANLKAFVSKVSKDFQNVTKANNSQTQVDEQLLLLCDEDDEVETAKIIQMEKENTKKGNRTKSKYENKQESEESLQKMNTTTKVDNSEFNENAHFESIEMLFLEDDDSQQKADVSENSDFLTFKNNIFIDVNEQENNQTELQIKELKIEKTQHNYTQEYETLLESDSNMATEYVEEHTEDEENKFMAPLDLYERVEFVTQSQLSPLQIENNCSGSTIELDSPINVTKTVKKQTPTKSPTKRRKRNVKVSTGTEARFICDKCHMDFSTRQNLNRHMFTHEGKKPFTCEECGKTFSQKGSLKQHAYIHTGERPHVCSICQRGFSQWKSLAFHMRRHTGEKPFSCEYCGSAFRQKDSLKSHLLKNHLITEQTGDVETHMCIICKEILDTEELLKEHIKRHVNQHKDLNPVEHVSATLTTTECSTNVNEFISSESKTTTDLLIEIANEEDEEELMEKDENDMGVVDMLAASTHVVDVSGSSAADPNRAKKFQCRKCFKRFALLKSLIRHLSVHKSDLYRCRNCDLTFDTKYALNYHCMKEHKQTDINLNECEECHLHFKDENELNEHLRDNHGLVCELCPDLSFKTRNSLLEHQIDHEDDNKNLL